MLDAFKSLLKSRKFLLMIVDVVVSLALLYFSNFPNVEVLVGILQPVVVAVIVGIAVEDAAEKSNGS